MQQYMILPSNVPANIHLLLIPNDYNGHEAFRHVTGLIAEIESSSQTYGWEEILMQLEAQGYEEIKFILGPAVD